jgi:hypothetical protein
MGFFSRLREAFGPGEPPEPQITDPLLGTMRWVENEEAWLGDYNDGSYSLAYDRKSRPAPELIRYAQDILTDSTSIAASLEEARAKANRDYQPYADEIASLTLGRLHFFLRRNEPCILADLEGGRGDRCWRIEYSGHRCDGIGFDS